MQYLIDVQTGIGVPHISGQQIFDFPIVEPERNVVEKFDNVVSIMVIHKQNINAENQLLENCKNLLLSKLATIEN